MGSSRFSDGKLFLPCAKNRIVRKAESSSGLWQAHHLKRHLNKHTPAKAGVKCPFLKPESEVQGDWVIFKSHLHAKSQLAATSAELTIAIALVMGSADF